MVGAMRAISYFVDYTKPMEPNVTGRELAIYSLRSN